MGLDYAEALRSHIRTLKRKLADEQLNYEYRAKELETVESEVAVAKEKQCELQHQLENEKKMLQDRRAQHEAMKIDAAVQRREIQSKRLQVAKLQDELVRKRESAEKEVDETLQMAREAAFYRESQLEASWRTKHLDREHFLRNLDEQIEELKQDIQRHLATRRKQPSRSAALKFLSAFENWSNMLQAQRLKTVHAQSLEEVRTLRSRHILEKDEELAKLEAQLASRKEAIASEMAQEEEDASKEEEELRERIARNRRRAEKSEREAAAHIEDLRQQELNSAKAVTRKLQEAYSATFQQQRLSVSTALPDMGCVTMGASALQKSASTGALSWKKASPADLRPTALHAEFPIIGSLEALDQELHGFRKAFRLTGR